LYFCLLPEFGGGSDRRENVKAFTSLQRLHPVEHPEAYPRAAVQWHFSVEQRD
jgi:hypothetical protein